MEIRGLTITGGSTTTSAGPHGGGILSSGDLTLADVVIADNEAAGSGGGIFAEEGSLTIKASTITRNTALGQNEPSHGGGVAVAAASLVIEHSLIADNHAETGSGGGVYAESGRSVFVSNSTISGNVSLKKGGGMAIADVNHAEIVHGTIAANSGVSAALFVAGSSLDLGHTIVADNTAHDPDAAFADFDFQETAVTARYNLIEAGRPIHGGDGNIVGVDPLLGPLANHGGTARSHPLLPGSPAIDAGERELDVSSDATDQRRGPFVRVFDDPDAPGMGIDLGAYERQTLDPAWFVVTTDEDELDENDDVSLREAIQHANGSVGPETITFWPELDSTFRLSLDLGELEITETLSIDGAGRAIRIFAQHRSRAFNFSSQDGDLILRDFSILNVKTTGDNQPGETTHNGGGIRFMSTGELQLIDSSIIRSSTEGQRAYGGAIFADRGIVTLDGSNIDGAATYGDNSHGGAIYAGSGDVTFIDSGITGSETNGDRSHGGGIFAGSGNVTLTDSYAQNVRSEGPGGTGGSIFTERGAVTLSGSRIIDSQSVGPGGGIHSAGPVTITSSRLSGNQSVEGGGGAIYSAQSVTIADSELTENRSGEGGGAVYATGDVAVANSTVNANRTYGAFAAGGGIHALLGDVTVTNSTLHGNYTIGAAAEGGAIFARLGDVSVDETPVSDNHTDGSHPRGARSASSMATSHC